MDRERKIVKRYQINNLIVKYNHNSGKWEVWAPRKWMPRKVLFEEFCFEKDAILFAQETHDFLTERGRKRKYGY